MKVKFVPQNVEFEIKPGQSVMHVAQDNGMYIKSVCKGVPSCAECRVRVVDGDYNVLPPGSEELSLIGTGHFIDHRRLSCQLKCFGDITVDMSEQIAKESGLMGGRKSKSRTQKDDRVEDVHAIRLNDSEGGARREKAGGERGDKKAKPPKNPLKIGAKKEDGKAPVSIDGGVSAPVEKASDIPPDVAAVPFPIEEAAAPARESREKSRGPREGRDQRGPREGRNGGDRQQPRDSRGPKQTGGGSGGGQAQQQNQGKQKQQSRGPGAGPSVVQSQGQTPLNPAQAKSERTKHHVMGEAGGDRESREALPRAEAIPKPQPITHSHQTKSVETRDSGSDSDDSVSDGEGSKGPRRKRRRGGRGSRGSGGGGSAQAAGGQGSGSAPGSGPRAQGGPGPAPQGKPTPKPGGRGPSGSTGSGTGGTSAPGKPS